MVADIHYLINRSNLRRDERAREIAFSMRAEGWCDLCFSRQFLLDPIVPDTSSNPTNLDALSHSNLSNSCAMPFWLNMTFFELQHTSKKRIIVLSDIFLQWKPCWISWRSGSVWPKFACWISRTQNERRPIASNSLSRHFTVLLSLNEHSTRKSFSICLTGCWIQNCSSWFQRYCTVIRSKTTPSFEPIHRL